MNAEGFSLSEQDKQRLSSIIETLKGLQDSGKLNPDSDAYQLIRLYNWFNYLSGLATPYIALERSNNGIGVWRWHPAMASLISFGYDDIMDEPFIGIRKDVYMEYFKDSKLLAIGIPKDNSCLILRFFKDAQLTLVLRIPVVAEKMKIFKEFLSRYNKNRDLEDEEDRGCWTVYLRPFENDDVVAGKALEIILLDPENREIDEKKFRAVFGVNC